MDAKWIVIILLAIAVVFLFFRGESNRKSVDRLNVSNMEIRDWATAVSTWNKETREEWAVVVNDDFWALRKFVCDKYPGECTDGDKKTDPPDPPPEFP